MAIDVRTLLTDRVRENVLLVFGERGAVWIEALPDVVADLARRWELRLTAHGYGGGSHSLAMPVTRPDGSPAVLKVPVQDDENRFEAAALRCYAGDGATLLYDEDPESGALLLERLEPGTSVKGDPLAVEIATGLLRRLRRPVPDGHPFPLVRDLVAGWTERIPGSRLPSPFREEVSELLPALAAPDGPEVLVNRDANLDNVLAARREPWLLIDPKPLIGEAAFDGGWLLVDVLRWGPAPTPSLAREVTARIGAGLGVTPQRVRAWALARIAEDVLWWTSTGGDPTEMLALASALLA
jgi:streptomycin 6-kinase